MIYSRIDTYSVILYGTSIKDVMCHLGIPISALEEVSKHGYKKHEVKTGDTFVWSDSGIRYECKYDEYDKFQTCDSIFDVKWSYLRLYLSSEGIDYIIYCNRDVDGFCFETLLCDIEFWSPISVSHKVTRCDFAFDFVNINDGEFLRLRKIISNADFDEKLSSCGRLYNGKKAGVSYSYHGGTQRTIYIGSPGSQKLLRIYDKKFQYTSNGIFDNSKVPKKILEDNISIDSWHRMELQTREDFAERYLVSCKGDFRYIMGEIAESYDICTSDGKTIAPLHKIFLNSKRVPIIQNANCVQPAREITVVCAWISSVATRKIIDIIGILGWEGFRNLINQSVRSRMSSTHDKRLFYLNSQYSELSRMAEQEGISFDDSGNIGDIVKCDDGAFYLGPFPYTDKKGPYV